MKVSQVFNVFFFKFRWEFWSLLNLGRPWRSFSASSFRPWGPWVTWPSSWSSSSTSSQSWECSSSERLTRKKTFTRTLCQGLCSSHDFWLVLISSKTNLSVASAVKGNPNQCYSWFMILFYFRFLKKWTKIIH